MGDWIGTQLTYIAATIAPPTMKKRVVFTRNDSYLLQMRGKGRERERERERERKQTSYPI